LLLLLPYRAKNPPERFPYITLALIAVNVLVYACTSDNFLSIRDGAVEAGALSVQSLSPLRLFTSMFLHADPFHLIGNMLFLWVFGSAVEGRLGYVKFPLVYLGAGLASAALHLIVDGLSRPEQWTIGASGAIMGMAGAYLWMFPHAAINVVFGHPTLLFMRFRLMEWRAMWVALYFFGFDIFYGFIAQATGGLFSDGVAHFAHLGGAAGGFLLVMALRERRDDEYVSEAQKTRVEAGGNLLAMPLHDLEALAEAQPDDAHLITAYCRKAATHYDGTAVGACVKALQKHQKVLIEKGDHAVLGPLVLALPDHATGLPPALLLALGSRYAIDGNDGFAARLFRRAFEQDPGGKDAEMALLRLARATEKTDDKEPGRAAGIYAEMLRRFPDGPQAVNAKQALQRLGPVTVVFSAGSRAESPLAKADAAMMVAALPDAPAPQPAMPTLTPVGGGAASDDGGLRPLGS